MNSKREFLGKTGMYFPNLFNPFDLNLVVALMKQLSAFCHNLKKKISKTFFFVTDKRDFTIQN